MSQASLPHKSTFRRDNFAAAQTHDEYQMIRYSLLVMAMFAIAIIAQKNWFRGLCFMLPLLAFLERSDMPRQMLGVSGLNPFNILLGIILIAWFVQRRNDGSQWGASKTVTRLLLAYMGIILISTVRAIMDFSEYQNVLALAGQDPPTTGRYVVDSVINSGKWMIPGLLISVGARSEERVRLAIHALLWTGAFFSILVISRMLPALIGSDDLASRALRVLDRDLGYHRVNLAAITASVAWAFLAAKPIIKSKFRGIISLAGFGLCTLAMVSTGGRGGMLAWIATAMLFGFLRWRKILVLIPAFALLAVLVIPGLQERVFEGFSSSSEEVTVQSERQFLRREAMGAIDESGRDRYAITSGRALVWPVVFNKAMEKPIAGHGRLAMHRTGIITMLRKQFGITTFGHPHNAYLELFLDMGLLGLIIVGAFFWTIFRAAVRTFSSPATDIQYVVASVVLAVLTVNLTASLASQSFYPKQGATLLWIALGLAFAWLTNKTAAKPVAESKVSGPATRAPQLH